MGRFRWTGKLEFQLLKLLGEGRTYRYVAEKLGCSKTTVKVKAKALGTQSRDLKGAVYPLNSIPARFLRTTPDVIRDWIARGWLPKPNISKTPEGRKFYRFTREQLEAFLLNEEAWVAWEPDDLVDRDLREWAREERAKVGWRWVSSREVLQTLGYAHHSITGLIERGFDRSKCVLYGAWWVRSDEVERFRSTMPNRHPGYRSVSERYGEESHLKSCILTDSQISFYTRIGDGDFAEGVRRLADELMSQERKAS